MKKILFDLSSTQPIGQTLIHGGGEYAKSILEKISIHVGDNQIDCFYFSNRAIDEIYLNSLNERGFNLIACKDYTYLKALVNNNEYDVFYSALPYDLEDLLFDKTKFIYTIHGLRPIEMPVDLYEYKFSTSFLAFIKWILKICFKSFYVRKKIQKMNKLINNTKNQIIITVSEHTLSSMKRYLKLPKNLQSHVFYSPAKKVDQFENNDFIINNNIEPKEYYLFISANRWIKNGYRTIKSFDNAITAGNTSKKMIVVGISKSQLRLNLKNQQHFIFFDYLESGELELLFKNSFCFLYTSLNEGFGYPPLEVMKYSVPVIASKIASIPEVLDESCIYINPFEIDSIQKAINEIESSDKKYKELCIKSYNRYESVNKKQESDLTDLVNLILEK